MKDDHQRSKGCGFVKFASREDAQKAIDSLHNIYHDEGAPRKMIVKYADTKEERMLRTMAKQFNSYNPYLGTSMESGLRTSSYLTHVPLTRSPFGMVSDFKRNEYIRNPYQSDFSAFERGGYASPLFTSPTITPPTPTLLRPLPSTTTVASGTRGPSGANLFVYNIPDTFTESDLQSLFSFYGNVVSALVFRNKVTGTSKGFGFVSYDSPFSAEKAIVALNGVQMGNRRLKVMIKRGNGNNISSLTHEFQNLEIEGSN